MTTTEAIEYLSERGRKTTAHKLRKWCERGWIVGAFKPPGGQWDIPASGLDTFIAQHMPHRRKQIRAIRAIREINERSTD